MYGVDSQYSSSGPSVVLVCASLKEKALLRQPALLPIGEYKGFGMETKLCQPNNYGITPSNRQYSTGTTGGPTLHTHSTYQYLVPCKKNEFGRSIA